MSTVVLIEHWWFIDGYKGGSFGCNSPHESDKNRAFLAVFVPCLRIVEMTIYADPVLNPPSNFECKSVQAQPVYKGFISWLFRIPHHYIVTAEYGYRSEPTQCKHDGTNDLSPVKIVTETIDHTKTGAKFKAHRESCNVPLNYFALKAGLSADYVKRLENGSAPWSEELFSRFLVIVAKLSSTHKSDVN